jgi:hypothetical protein
MTAIRRDGGEDREVVAMTIDLVSRVPQWEREAEQYEEKAAALRQMIAAVKALNGEAEAILTGRTFEAHRTRFEVAPLASNGPRGREAVRRVMGEAPDKVWKVVEVKREMLRRGWAPNPKSVEASVKRLRQDGELEAVSYGHYRLAGQAKFGRGGERMKA